jgi:hypothetical protein
MHIHHPGAQMTGGFNRPGHRVGNVMKFQIEEDPVAAIGQCPHDRRSLGCEQLAANLEAAHLAAQRVGHRKRC